jgi:hypothetical protein
MKNYLFAAAAIVASLSAVTLGAPAFAQDAQPGTTGHYEWRTAPSFGSRASLLVRTRVWVADAQQLAQRDCAMMRTAMADCMDMAGKPHNG